MGELEEKLENILGNPQAMAQIMSLAQSLNLGGSGAGGPGQTDQAQPQAAEQNPAQEAHSGESRTASPPAPAAAPAVGLGELLGNLDAGTLSAAAGLLGRFNGGGGDDQRAALLAALRPFVREERYAKLDRAVQIARLSRLIRSGLELFRQRKEDGHV